MIITSNGCITDTEKTPSIGIDIDSLNFGTITSDAQKTFYVWNDGAGGKLRYSIEFVTGSMYFTILPSTGSSGGENNKTSHRVHALCSHIPEGQTVYGELRISCSNANDSPRSITLSAKRAFEQTYEEMNDSGWSEYVNGNYQQAKDNFTKSISRCPSEIEAYVGKGWCDLKLSQIESSIQSFNDALAKEASGTTDDIYAGLCFAYDSQDLHEECLTASSEISVAWEFKYDPSLDYNDIILLRAISYYAIGEFPNSLNEVRQLDNNFNVNTETIDGRAELANKIEHLDSIF